MLAQSREPHLQDWRQQQTELRGDARKKADALTQDCETKKQDVLHKALLNHLQTRLNQLMQSIADQDAKDAAHQYLLGWARLFAAVCSRAHEQFWAFGGLNWALWGYNKKTRRWTCPLAEGACEEEGLSTCRFHALPVQTQVGHEDA